MLLNSSDSHAIRQRLLEYSNKYSNLLNGSCGVSIAFRDLYRTVEMFIDLEEKEFLDMIDDYERDKQEQVLLLSKFL